MGNLKKNLLLLSWPHHIINKKKEKKTIQLTKARRCLYMVKPINDVP